MNREDAMFIQGAVLESRVIPENRRHSVIIHASADEAKAMQKIAWLLNEAGVDFHGVDYHANQQALDMQYRQDGASHLLFYMGAEAVAEIRDALLEAVPEEVRAAFEQAMDQPEIV